MSTRDDGALLREYRAGSQDAFRILAERYGALVYGSCLKSLRRPEPAEDAAQAVFLVLARKADRIVVRTTLIPWLLATSRVVCRNVARDEGRRLRHEVPLSEDVPAPVSALDNSIFEALERLRDPEREAVVLRFVQGLTLREIGRAQGIPEDAARMRVQRGIARLRERVAPSITLTSSFLSHLSNPGAASPAVLQLASRSMTMFTPFNVSAVSAVGFTSLCIVGLVAALRSHPAHLDSPIGQSPRTLAAVSTAVPASSEVSSFPALTKPFTMTYELSSHAPQEGRSYLTLSSDGRHLLAIEKDQDSTVRLVFLSDGRRFYALMPGQGANMWVTDELSLSPQIPFVGIDFPGLPPRIKPTAGPGSANQVGSHVADIRLGGWPPHYLSGTYQVANLGKDGAAVRTLIAGKTGAPDDVWNLSGFERRAGMTIASTIECSSYDRGSLNNGKLSSQTTYSLKSFDATCASKELFTPEHYLHDGDNVEYKIPLQAKMNLDFQYHPGSTIEQLAIRQDDLEMRIHHLIKP